jgi:hypothetical protein
VTTVRKIMVGIIALVVLFYYVGFGMQTIGFFGSIRDNGLRQALCGTQGCTDIGYVLEVIVTLAVILAIFLVPIVLGVILLRRRATQ